MIKRISRKKLDVDKYTECLSKSVNYRIYAEVWYLDTLVENNWDCYVLNDYEAIMPLPFVKKFGIKFITQPIYCQQLGVFHQKNLSKEIFKKFEKKLHRNLVRAYSFNEENTEMFEPKGKLKVNYILDLNQSYEKIFNNYSSNRRKELRRTSRMELIINEINNLKNFQTLKNAYAYINIHKLEDKYSLIFEYLINREQLKIYDIYTKEKVLLGSQAILFSKNRIICFSFARNKKEEKHNTSAYILDHIIKKNNNTSLIFDFEGSMIPSIGKFMEGYSPKKKFYSLYSNINFK
ncbi:hypothetical protein [Empedobacter brevis]|uniref:BioF2-like acetyltransferase domain-containing protein n=1 Tax=Empedobacter brevis NBRC 14943 = ATCC 43319 TaxID=1218108 RepID=A0A511NDJ2_9FLAO|nr:hypothetical protein [Empedobacter brevis]GEM50885.1 hypothetical protein EB1_06750 [Empedobacter brevis NBRC 14943 = ATCC 43319]